MRTLGLTALILLTLALFAALALPWVLPRPGLDGSIPVQPFSDSHFTEVEGVRLHYRRRPAEADSEPLVILLHGYGGSSFSWRHSLDALETAGHEAIAIDMPPFGYSQRAGQGADWTGLVGGLVDQLAPGRRLVLVGHSMGAGVAAKLAASRPDQVEQLILVAGTPRMRARSPGPGLRLVNRVPALGRWAEVLAAHRLVSEAQVGQMLASAFGREPSAEELAGYFYPLTIPGTYPALLQRMATESEQIAEGWQTISTLLIWGEDDRWVPLSSAETLLEQYPEITLERMPETGHNPMDTEVDAFNGILVDALGR